MRHLARIDGNQRAVVDALRSIGATVVSLATIGNGCPDLLVGYHGRTTLLEVKDGAKPPSARLLTVDEVAFFASWRGGPLWLVKSPTEAVMRVAEEFTGGSTT